MSTKPEVQFLAGEGRLENEQRRSGDQAKREVWMCVKPFETETPSTVFNVLAEGYSETSLKRAVCDPTMIKDGII
ncbi:hypothetical protein RRG08_032998 [Elysia crispata]|uniref:Uncharacterized protein n=1 Tax=Elysia crispata TaxID=231223 RepID=A0AAE0YRY9_9GAST|nr:hypothetical protein RRG08_032998 [Elysia crispata]